MVQAFHREQAIVEILTELNLGQARKDTGMLGSILSEVGLNQLQESLKGEKILNAAHDDSAKKLQSRIKEIDKASASSRANVLSDLQTLDSTATDVKTPAIVTDDMPDFAKEQKRELRASQQNMVEYADRMRHLKIKVGDAGTMMEDVGAAFGGEAEDRQLGISVQTDMLEGQKEVQKGLKDELKIRGHNIKALTDQRDLIEKQKDAEVKKLELMKKTDAGYKKQKKLVASLRSQMGAKTTAINKEKKAVDDVNTSLQTSQARHADLLRTKDKAINVDRALRATERKGRQEQQKAYREHKEEQRAIADAKRRQIQIDRVRNKLAREYNISISSMADKFKTTLVAAMAISTGAVMAFYYKLNMLVETFKEFEKELINAQSIFQTNQETLFSLSDEVVKFGTKYGIELNKASEGLYQLASAGLSAEESMMVLNNTLKLSMAVQGDHNALSKLTVQTIYGFGLQMSDSAELTDKFAHAINKSLIEWDDLASSVKFAMPFFITTGQSIDQLLGALEILTNRALEAGIAGRGLRQALAMFAKHADDNTAAFRKMGIEITDAEGNFKDLTEIAKDFSDAFGPISNDTELLTKLLEDLNVRGATAFIHLVQNADEFQEAVDDLQNSAGAATEMADIQQQSLANQIQRVKNALRAPFLLSDEIGKQQGYMNAFSLELHRIVGLFENMFVVIEDGVVTGLTPLGENLRNFVIVALQEFAKIAMDVKELFLDMTDNGKNFGAILQMITIPLRMMIRLLQMFGPEMIEAILLFKVINGVLPITNMLTTVRIMLMDQELIKTMKEIQVKQGLAWTNSTLAGSYSKLMLSQAGVMTTMFVMIYATRILARDSQKGAFMIGALAGAFIGLAFAIQLANASITAKGSWLAAGVMMAAGAVAFGAFNVGLQKMMKPPEIDYPELAEVSMADVDLSIPVTDLGGRMLYDTGGRMRGGMGGRHFPVMVEPGETVVSKTMNMLDGGAGAGITLNIYGDVYDSDNFAEKISEVLPSVLRRTNDIGGI